MKNFGINRIKEFLLRNRVPILMFFCFSLLNIFFLCWNFSFYNLTFGTTFILLLVGSIILEIILCLFLFIAKSKKWPIEKLFLVIGLIVGLFYVFAIPPGRAPDEESHFFRVYELSTGHLVSDVSEKVN